MEELLSIKTSNLEEKKYANFKRLKKNLYHTFVFIACQFGIFLQDWLDKLLFLFSINFKSHFCQCHSFSHVLDSDVFKFLTCHG